MANPSNDHYHSSTGLEKCQFFHAEIAMLTHCDNVTIDALWAISYPGEATDSANYGD